MKKDDAVKAEQCAVTPQPLAIIGIGCIFPKADNVSSYWSTIKNGVDAITEIPSTHWKVADYHAADPKAADRTYGKRGGFITPIDFNPLEYGLPPNVLEATDTSQILGMVAAGEALKDAGYGADRQWDRERVSVILGVTGTLELVIPLGARLGHPLWRKALQEAGVDSSTTEEVVQRISDSYVPWQEASFPGLLGNVVAGRISKQFDLGGTNCVVDAACASSLSAINLAGLELATGRSDMVVTGGVDTFNDIFMYMCFSKTPALSPSGDARPFDAKGDGTTLGEGLGMVVLKRLADAERDGDRIYAVIRGVGSSSDGKGEAIYAPSASGQQKALRAAYREAGVTPDSIELLEAHGTGTKVGDAVEVSALREVYGEADRPWCALGSVKSQIGHTKAAAGAAGLIKAALALYNKVLPPTIKVNEPLPEVTGGRTPFYINTDKRPWISAEGHPRRAAVSAFGFGGSNFHCVLEEHDAARTATDWDGEVQILPFSAADRAGLFSVLEGIPAEATWSETRDLAARFRSKYDPSLAFRLVLVVEKTGAPLAAAVAKARALLQNDSAHWTTPDGSCFSCNAETGGIALLFPGQGAQYVGMLRDLACHFPEMLESLEAAEQPFREGDARLADFIYPPAPFSPEGKVAQEAALRDTAIAQPAIGAVSIGAYRVLAKFGLMPQAAGGHSYGELTALCAAERLGEAEFHRISGIRGKLMAKRNGDSGSMLAVAAPMPVIEKLVADRDLDLVIANRNAPDQAVLSGNSAEVARAAELCAAEGLACKILPVSAAFHSPLVADASGPFLSALQDVAIEEGTIPVYANSTAAPYPADAGTARELLGNQLAQPVEFVAQIEAMHAAGSRTFLELGPGARLTGLVKAILGDRPHTALALDSSSGKRPGLVDLARVLAQLAVLGHRIDLTLWDGDHTPAAIPAKKPAMTVPIAGCNYVKPRQQRPPVERSQPEPQPAQPAAARQENMAIAAPPAAAPAAHITEALRITRDSMAALQKLHEQTANLHRQFLEGQEAAGKTIQALLEQQQRLMAGVPATTAVPVADAPARQSFPAAAVIPPQTVPAATPLPVTAPPAGRAEHVLLDVISERTGYPVEMLELDMALDADLGIDSIKRVEILSVLQERLPEAPAVKPEHLGTLQTLRQIVAHLGAGAIQATAATSAPPTVVNSAPSKGRAQQVLLDVISDRTGYPVEMLELDMALDADLGIDSIKRVEILSVLQERLPEAPAVKPEHLGTLQTLRQIVAHLEAGVPTATAAASAPTVAVAAALPPGRAQQVLLDVISDRTGYPVEMLELDMALDADLGIDSIKRVEILSVLQERLPEAPAVKPEHLGTLQTLRQIVAHLEAGATPATPPAAGAPTVAVATGLQAGRAQEVLLDVISDRTGYPVEMLELDMALDADLGIDSIKRVEILSILQERLPEAPAVKPEHLAALQTLRQIVAHLEAGASPVEAAVTAQAETVAIDNTSATGGIERSVLVTVPLDTSVRRTHLAVPVGSEIWITANGSILPEKIGELLQAHGYRPRLLAEEEWLKLAPPARLGGLLIVAPADGANGAFFRHSFALLQKNAPALKASGAEGGATFVTVSRLDGRFGLAPSGTLADPLSGGLAGLAKTAHREWPDVHCKAIDLAGNLADLDAAAAAVVEEMFLSGPREVGIAPEGRFIPELVNVPVPATPADAPAIAGTVVISGGGRGVTAEIAVAIARQYRTGLLLLGRSPEPTPEPAWLVPLTEEGAIKKAVLDQFGKMSPKQLEEHFRSLMANRELLRNLQRIEEAGSKVMYRSIDIRDGQAVAEAVADARTGIGPVTGLIHGAGVLADRRIEEKTSEQFDMVYGTKVDGLQALLAAVEQDDLRFLALFSSSTGRFGRIGQSDYAISNEILNKLAQQQSRLRPGCRVVSINWGPWDGGMVTPSLKKMFAEEGVGIIDLAEGADHLLREIMLPQTEPVETVVLGAVPKEPVALPSRPAEDLTLAVQIELSIDRYPFLTSHVINGKAVLPMAMIAEWMGHGALHNNPGFRLHGFNDLRILKGVVFDQNKPCSIRILTGKARKRDAFHTVPVELVSGNESREVLHARAEILLATKLPEGIRSITEIPARSYPHQDGEFYSQGILFHGPHLQGIIQVDACSPEGIVASVKPAPDPREWIAEPLRNSWLTDPLAIDCAFQLMILWSFERSGKASLPCFAGRYRQFQPTFPPEGVQIVIQVTRENEQSATADMEFFDPRTGKLVARLEGYECVIDASLNSAFRRNRLPQQDRVKLGAA